MISGAVISDDRLGNFYKTLVLDDGTAGIEIALDAEQIFKHFMIHTRVNVRCSGLWLGSYGGTLSLGAAPWDEFQNGPIPESEITRHLTADTVFYGEIIPRTLSFEELSLSHISTFAAFEGVRFVEQGSGWAVVEASEPGADPPSATNRHLVDAAGDTLVVRTSRHARFASWPLPSGTGRIEGVVGYFNGDYQLVVCDSEKFSASKD
jgi:hypothetical protein